MSILTRLRRRRPTPHADPVGELIAKSSIFNTPERRAAMESLALDLKENAELGQLIDDEIVRQLAALLRDHPVVVAALEEVA